MKKHRKKTSNNPTNTWDVDVQIPRDFQSKVWEKIADRRTVKQESFLSKIVQWFKELSANPIPAAALAVLVILVGFGGGQFQGFRDEKRNESVLESRYISTIDPYAQAKQKS